MMAKIILDTNAYTAYLTGDKKILTAIAGAEIIYMSIFVLGELYAGFKGGSKEEKNRQILNTFIQKPGVIVINATERTSEIFGEIKHSLKRAGTPLPINDVWIAAHGIETGSVLISYDGYFKKISNLQTWKELAV
jgi:tRNA(fMet)-specific endonuclease VapC